VHRIVTVITRPSSALAVPLSVPPTLFKLSCAAPWPSQASLARRLRSSADQAIDCRRYATHLLGHARPRRTALVPLALSPSLYLFSLFPCPLCCLFSMSRLGLVTAVLLGVAIAWQRERLRDFADRFLLFETRAVPPLLTRAGLLCRVRWARMPPNKITFRCARLPAKGSPCSASKPAASASCYDLANSS
jgi:hypothetical protein